MQRRTRGRRGAVVLAAAAALTASLSGCGDAESEQARRGQVESAQAQSDEAPSDVQSEPLTGIFVIRPDGSGLRRIYPRGADPTWSPRGGNVAFEDGAGIWINVVDADGAGIRPVLNLPCCWAEAPAWSPDGKRLAFHDYSGDRIFVVNVDGSSPRRLRQTDASSPAWSPDGKSIAYDDLNGISAVRLDSARTRRLVREGELTDFEHAGSPTWSPSGRLIAFSLSFNVSEIYTRAVSGGPLRRVTRSGAGSCSQWFCLSYTVDSNPAWSPNGKLIAFDRILDSSLP